MRLLAVLSVLLCGAVASACPPVCVRKVAVVKQEAVVVKEAVVVPVITYVPTYSVSYVQPPVTPQVQPPAPPQKSSSLTDEDILLLVQTVRQINTRLTALEAKLQGQASVPPSQLATYEAVLAARCASCHAASVAEKKGAAFVLIDDAGRPAALSLKEQARVVREIERGHMPKDGQPLSPAEIAVVKARFEKGI